MEGGGLGRKRDRKDVRTDEGGMGKTVSLGGDKNV